jgi:Secretion system C-terminal sorting domain
VTLYPDKEIQIRTTNVPSENHYVKFTLSIVGNGFVFTGNNCEYEMGTMEPAIHIIHGNYEGSEYYYTIDPEVYLPSNYEFIHGLLELKVEYAEDQNNIFSQNCYWDVADCNYYGPVSCSAGGGGDIVLEYNAQGNQIFFFWGNSPDETSIWEDVSGQTKRYIDYTFPGTIPCPLTATPSGFSLSGSIGGHPTLSWNSNSEAMLGGYCLYQSLNGAPYTLLTTLNSQITSFTDHGVIIGNSRFDPRACYGLTSFGRVGVESLMTLPKCVSYSGLNKKDIIYEEKALFKNKLYNAFPNPFNPSTSITYQLKKGSFVKIKIYDILGRVIATIVDEFRDEGTHTTKFNASFLSTGSYIYSLELNDYLETKVFTVIK